TCVAAPASTPEAIVNRLNQSSRWELLAGRLSADYAAGARSVKENTDGAVRIANVHTLRRQNGGSDEALPGVRLPGAQEGRPRQEARWLLPGRYRHDQPTRPSLEV